MIALATLLILQATPMRFASIFTDHMVLQRQRSVPVWGTATPGATVDVAGSWGAKAKAIADASGRWEASIKTGKAGGPYVLTATSPDAQAKVEDVLLGEVWLCGGQSNMEWPLGEVPGYVPSIEGAKEEVAQANFPNIRLLTVPRISSDIPLTTADLRWERCSPKSVRTFSATGYLFGKKLHTELGVPIGLVSSNVGGTDIELWMSEPALRMVPSLTKSIDQKVKARSEYAKALNSWSRSYSANDAEILAEAQQAEGWFKLTNAQPFEGEPMLGEFDGAVWYRAAFRLPDNWSPADGVVELETIDDEDVTYVNGNFVGRTTAYNVPRNYRIPAANMSPGWNLVVVKVLDTGGRGGFSRPENFVRIGQSKYPLEAWAFKKGQFLSELPVRPAPPESFSNLYNAMIHPLVPFAIQGAIWYQGEANVGRGYQYRETFPVMIKSWRTAFRNPDMPFFFVQIAPWLNYLPDQAADLRESQLLTLKTKNTGMVVTTDITPNFGDIHPNKKREVGARLAMLALNKTYQLSKFPTSGPQYKSNRIEGSKIRVSFDHADNLSSNGPLVGFEIAAQDGKFFTAQATIEGNSVVVSAELVPNPQFVRYGWANAPTCNLKNGAGLPASPFRTDNLKLPTQGLSW